MSILKFGSRGTEVSALQTALNSKLTPNPRLVPDGNFGGLTASAVKKFQAANWLVEDGEAGPCTQNCLFGKENFTPILHKPNFIAQPTDETCWATSTAMMTGSTVAIVINKTPGSMVLPPSPQNVNQPPPLNVGGLRNSSETDQALPTGEAYGSIHGLICHAPMSWMAVALRAKLQSGPMMWDMLWDATSYITPDPSNPGKYLGSSGHMLVIVGIRGDDRDDSAITLRVYDPWPPNKGKIYSVGYAKWMREVPTRTYRIFTKT
jgi:peptidoglycan hydrolase-like protein with peptidoglycan-binding domain